MKRRLSHNVSFCCKRKLTPCKPLSAWGFKQKQIPIVNTLDDTIVFGNLAMASVKLNMPYFKIHKAIVNRIPVFDGHQVLILDYYI